MPTELRRSPRYPFFASAEVADAASKSIMKARTSEISRHGCYLDMVNPFFDGTTLSVRIVHEGQALDAAARVIHSTPNIGMGVSFDQIAPDHQPIIEKWLSALEAS
jgi:hypothetical protein